MFLMCFDVFCLAGVIYDGAGRANLKVKLKCITPASAEKASAKRIGQTSALGSNIEPTSLGDNQERQQKTQISMQCYSKFQ